jgi:hypothetical protein
MAMRKKITVILVLAGLITFSCEKMEITRSDDPRSKDLANENLRDGLFGPTCKLPDAVVGKIVITNVVGNTFEYSFVVGNAGASTLPLSHMYFQTYLSTDNVFDPSDVAAGGSVFGDTAPSLAYGETYVQSWYYNPTTPVNITDYHFLVVQLLVRPKFLLKECSTANNIAIRDIGCNLADGYVSDVNITNVNHVANTFDYTFTVTNSSWGALPLSQMLFQTYVSKDAILGAGDEAAGGSIFGASAPTLFKNQSYAHSWYYNPSTPKDLTEYKYLIIQLIVWDGTVPECDTDNNTVAERIVIDIPRNGLVAFYPFNSNANDESGNNLNGTVNGATPGADRFGYGNKAYSFDGVNDYIAVGNPTQLQITNTITLSVWVKSPAFSYGQNILSKTACTNSSCTEGNGYKLKLTQTGDGTEYYGAFIYYPGSGAGGLNFAGGASFSANVWVNYTFTLDGSNAKWYKNGVEEFAASNHQPLTAAALGDFEIGRGSGGGFHFTGPIDDVAVYNVALSPSEVLQLYNQNISQ